MSREWKFGDVLRRDYSGIDDWRVMVVERRGRVARLLTLSGGPSPGTFDGIYDVGRPFRWSIEPDKSWKPVDD